MAGPFGLGDPAVFEGLPLPGSPVTASGEDPDEVREREASARSQGAQPWRGTPFVLPIEGDGAPANAPANQPPAAPASVRGPGGNFEPAGFNADTARQAMSGQLTAGQKLSAIADQMQPDPTIAQLEEKRLQDSAAAPDPSAPQYKVGFGTKVLRGLKGAGLGMAEHGIFGAGLGALAPQMTGGTAYSAPSDAYDVALAKNQKQVAGDVDALSTAQGNFKQAQDLRVAQQKANQEGGEAFKGAGATATTQEGEEQKAALLPIDQQKADTEQQRAYNESPDGKLKITQGQIDARTRLADQQRMPPGYMRNRFILTGEMQPAKEATAEEVAVNRILKTWPQEHGGQGPKTVGEWQSIYAAAKGGTAAETGGGAGKDLREAAALAERNVKILTDQMGSKSSVLWSDQEKQQHQKELDDAKQMLAGYQARLAGGADAAAPGAPANGPAAAQGPQAAQGQDGQLSPDGTQVMKGGKMMKATGADGRVRMQLPDGRHATFDPAKAAQAARLGAKWAGGA